MNRWMGICAAALLCVVAVGCGRSKSDQDAIRTSIETRLNDRMDLNMGAMDHEVKQINVDGDHAAAQVEFRLKGKPAGSGMSVQYTLQRQGKDWVVQNSQVMGMDGMPPGAAGPGGQQLPQGHPAMGDPDDQ